MYCFSWIIVTSGFCFGQCWLWVFDHNFFFFVIAYCLCPHFWDSKHYSAHSKPDSKHLEITPVFVDLKNGTITDTFVRLKKKWKSQIFLRSKHQPLPIQENEWVLTCLHHKVRSHLCTASAEKTHVQFLKQPAGRLTSISGRKALWGIILAECPASSAGAPLLWSFSTSMLPPSHVLSDDGALWMASPSPAGSPLFHFWGFLFFF